MKKLTPSAAGMLVIIGDAETKGIDIYFELLHKQVRKTLQRDWFIRAGELVANPYGSGVVHRAELTSKGRDWHRCFYTQARPPWLIEQLEQATPPPRPVGQDEEG